MPRIRFRRERAAPFLRLGRATHGEPAGPLQPDQRCSSWSASAIVYATLEPRYRLADQVPDREQAVAASSRLDAKLTGANPIDVLIEFPAGRLALCAGDARDDRRRALDHRAAGGRRQRLVAGDAAALARREGRHHRRRAC